MCKKTPSSAYFSPMMADNLPTRSFSRPCNLASDRSPLANPTFVPHSLSSDRAKLFIESCHARLGVELRALRGDHRHHKCIPNSEEARVMVRPVTFISVFLGALRVEHLRAIGKAPSYQRRPNPMLKTEQLPARVFNDLSNPEPGHTTGASGRCGAQRDGGAGPGRTGRREIDSLRGQPSLLPPKASNTIVLTDFSEA